MMKTVSIQALIVVLMAATSASAQVPGNPFNYSRTTSFTFDPTTGFQKTVTTEPTNAPSCKVSTFSYDSYGNRTGETVSNCTGAPSAAVFQTRSASADFTSPASQSIVLGAGTASPLTVSVIVSQGMFPTTKVDPVGNSSSATFDPRFDTLQQSRDANQRTLSITYDDFGRPIRRTSGDGTSVIAFYCILPGRGLDQSSNTYLCPTPAASEVPDDAVAFVHQEPRSAVDAKSGPYDRSYVDRLNRIIRRATESFDGAQQPAAFRAAVVVEDIVFDDLGNEVIRTSPYFLASRSTTLTSSNDLGAQYVVYDALNRPVQVYRSEPLGADSVSMSARGSIGYGNYGVRSAARQSAQYSGLVVRKFDAAGRARVEESNTRGEIVRVTDALGAQTVYQYDAFGQLVFTRDALQNVTTANYTLWGLRSYLFDPNAGSIAQCFNALGEMVATQNSKMRGSNSVGACPAAPTTGSQANTVVNWTTVAYDRAGRVKQRSEPEFVSTWHYDLYSDGTACPNGKGRLCQVVTSHGLNKKFSYDAAGRLDGEMQSFSGGPTFGSRQEFDPTSGRLLRRTFPTGLQVAFGYTALGYPETVVVPVAATVSPLPSTYGGPTPSSASLPANYALWTAHSSDAVGRVLREQLGNGVVTSLAFNPLSNRPTDISVGVGGGSSVLSHHYDWTAVGTLYRRTDQNGSGTSGPVIEQFTHDELNRLTEYQVAGSAVPGGSQSVSVRYNALGMVLSKSDVGTFIYGQQNQSGTQPHALASYSTGSGGTRYSYDLNGNVTTASSGKYGQVRYTSFNQPDSQVGLTGAEFQLTWVYDEEHKRIRQTKTNTSFGTRTTWQMHGDNQGTLSFEREENSAGPSSNRHFIMIGGRPVVVLHSAASLAPLVSGQLWPNGANSLTLSEIEYWHADHLGSVAALTDHVGTLTERFAYDAFGKRRHPSGPLDPANALNSGWRPGGTLGTGRSFTAHESLDEAGLIHMNGRLYDPMLARFLQADPYISQVFNLQSFNRYSYCLNSPLGCVDPSGELVICITAPSEYAGCAGDGAASAEEPTIWSRVSLPGDGTRDLLGSGAGGGFAPGGTSYPGPGAIYSGSTATQRVSPVYDYVGSLMASSEAALAAQTAYQTKSAADYAQLQAQFASDLAAVGAAAAAQQQAAAEMGAAAAAAAAYQEYLRSQVPSYQAFVGPLGTATTISAPTAVATVAQQAAKPVPPGAGMALTGAAAVAVAVAVAGDTPNRDRPPYWYVTYTRVHPVTGTVYAGRTSGFAHDPRELVARRGLQQMHLNTEGFARPVLDRAAKDNLRPDGGYYLFGPYMAIRGREQQLIDYFGGARSVGGTARNSINGVGDWNPLRPAYLDASTERWGTLKDNSPKRNTFCYGCP